jgi:hypothetical protein
VIDVILQLVLKSFKKVERNILGTAKEAQGETRA